MSLDGDVSGGKLQLRLTLPRDSTIQEPSRNNIARRKND